MAQSIVRQITNNAPLKLFSLVLGYCIWHIISSHQTISRTITIPVSFYNTQESSSITAPETVRITLRGKRSLLTQEYLSNLALHIDAETLAKQKNIVLVNSAKLFLPESITLVNYVPSPLLIEIQSNQKSIDMSKDIIA